MEPFRQRRVLIVVAVVALAAGAAWGQPLGGGAPALFSGRFDDARVQDLYRAFEAGFGGDAGGLGAEVIATAAQATAEPGQPEAVAGTCVMLTGAGGNPRIDGGGDLLAAMPRFAPPRPYFRPGNAYRLGRTLRHDGAPPAGLTLEVIDAFDLAWLETSLGRWVHGGATLSVGAHGDLRELWAALYGPRATDGGALVPHGHLVLFHLLGSLVEDVGPLTIHRVAVPTDDHAVLSLSVGPAEVPATVTLRAVQFDRIDTIKAAVAAARSTPGAVVVTSWGLVDCTLATRYGASATYGGLEEVRDFATYVRNALLQRGQAAWLLQMLCQAFAPEIATFLGEDGVECGSSATPEEVAGILTVAVLAASSVQAQDALGWHDDLASTFFASAGNQGLPFPMPPAAWSGVVGVEACTWPGRVRSPFSNLGTTGAPGASSVLALGAWFETDERSRDPQDRRLGYWGTSFAAPAAAARYATRPWDLTGGGHVVLDSCRGRRASAGLLHPVSAQR